jgi:spermidine synthase
VVYAKSTPYQRIIVTRGPQSFQLFLNGNLQFNSSDEYRYHEALVHPAMTLAGSPQHVLVLGGGDGLAMREVLRHPSVRTVTLVDIDPEMTKLADEFPLLRELNQGALRDPRVSCVHEDAMIWLEQRRDSLLFDAVLIDFPDPNTFTLGKLYTTRFYRLLKPQLTPQAVIGIQCTSPLIARNSFWCIIRTLEASGLVVKPYQTTVPSFGVWGYALAKLEDFETPAQLPAHLQGTLKFLDNASLRAMFSLSPDLQAVPVEINRLDNQMLVRYYEVESQNWN